uniref:interleukin-6 receptor subunit alpha-like isoform X2 n=1 Tax=Myxine glutinosa TaxID=7769 RepID=UPI00358FA137
MTSLFDTVMVNLITCLWVCITGGFSFVCNIKEAEWMSSEFITQKVIRAGSTNVTVHCMGSENIQVAWKWNAQLLNESDQYVVRGGILTLLVAGEDSGGAYTCHTIPFGEMLSSTTLHIAYDPDKPELSCEAKNPFVITCTWTAGRETHLPTTYQVNASYSGETLKCFKKIDNMNSCFILVKDMDFTNFIITVTASNLLGSKPSNTLRFFLKDKVIPDPPIKLEARVKDGHTNFISLSWKYPHRWTGSSEGYNLVFQIQYKAMGETEYKKVKAKQLKYVIMDVRNNACHLFQVRAREELGRLWSSWSETVFASASNETQESHCGRGSKEIKKDITKRMSILTTVEPTMIGGVPSPVTNADQGNWNSVKVNGCRGHLAALTMGYFILGSMACLLYLTYRKKSRDLDNSTEQKAEYYPESTQNPSAPALDQGGTIRMDVTLSNTSVGNIVTANSHFNQNTI